MVLRLIRSNHSQAATHSGRRRRLTLKRKLKMTTSSSKPSLATVTSCAALLAMCLICSISQVEQTSASKSALEAVRRTRIKRSLFELPDGADLLVSEGSGRPIRTSFSCEGLGYGYYADPENDCKIFHICQSFKMSDGSIYNNHWSFVCGNQTVFNQVSLSCSHPEDAVPCENARDFYYVNDYFGDARAPSVKDSDLGAAHELVARAYGSRLSSSSSSR